MKFLIDMPLSPGLAAWLREQGHDAIHAAAAGLHRAADTEILARGKRESRTIITADLDYPQLLALAQATEPSVILFRGGTWSEAAVIARMAVILRRLSASDVENSIIVADRDHIRRRRLPISGDS